jgi:hypothetical protein
MYRFTVNVGRWILTQLFICFISCCYQRIPAASILNHDFYLGDSRYTAPIPESVDDLSDFPPYDPNQPIHFGATVAYSRPTPAPSLVTTSALLPEGDISEKTTLSSIDQKDIAQSEIVSQSNSVAGTNEAEVAALAAVKVVIQKVGRTF